MALYTGSEIGHMALYTGSEIGHMARCQVPRWPYGPVPGTQMAIWPWEVPVYGHMALGGTSIRPYGPVYGPPDGRMALYMDLQMAVWPWVLPVYGHMALGTASIRPYGPEYYLDPTWRRSSRVPWDPTWRRSSRVPPGTLNSTTRTLYLAIWPCI